MKEVAMWIGLALLIVFGAAVLIIVLAIAAVPGLILALCALPFVFLAACIGGVKVNINGSEAKQPAKTEGK